MKTIQDKKLTEHDVNSRISHRSFLEHTSKAVNVKSKKMLRRIDKRNQGILSLLGLQDYTTRSKVSIHPEFVAFAFHLYGVSRKLFLYIVFYELNNDNCRFTINDVVINRFIEFCVLFGEREVTNRTILQAVRSLVRKNTMIVVEDNMYMLNPLIAGGSNENKRRRLIDAYCNLLEYKGLDTSTHFYPRYHAAP